MTQHESDSLAAEYVLSANEAPLAPAADLWQRIASALEAVGPLGDPVTVRADEGEWETVIEGIFKKRLFVDREQGIKTFLLRLAPVASYPAHSHAMAEECLMLEGEVKVGVLHLKAGDHHLAPAGSVHSELVSETGALIYIRGELSAA